MSNCEAGERFDEQLFAAKLFEMALLPAINESFFPTNSAINGYLAALRERLDAIDRVCRGIWQTQGYELTPEFVREVLAPKVVTQIDAVEGASINRASSTNAERWGPAWAYLASELSDLRSEFVNRYEQEVEGSAAADTNQRVSGFARGRSKPGRTAHTGRRNRGQGGRPRNDEERRRVIELKAERKTWKEIAAAINAETGQSKSEDAYRGLLRRTAPQLTKKIVQN